ncbi:hypothetical protein FRB93_001906 [Tulasnella sp. JGI-2019a]|nr:hypothetical protein FRB93_001906 [Tulasnella sp. JGI-2019a]
MSLTGTFMKPHAVIDQEEVLDLAVIDPGATSASQSPSSSQKTQTTRSSVGLDNGVPTTPKGDFGVDIKDRIQAAHIRQWPSAPASMLTHMRIICITYHALRYNKIWIVYSASRRLVSFRLASSALPNPPNIAAIVVAPQWYISNTPTLTCCSVDSSVAIALPGSRAYVHAHSRLKNVISTPTICESEAAVVSRSPAGVLLHSSAFYTISAYTSY